MYSQLQMRMSVKALGNELEYPEEEAPGTRVLSSQDHIYSCSSTPCLHSERRDPSPDLMVASLDFALLVLSLSKYGLSRRRWLHEIVVPRVVILQLLRNPYRYDATLPGTVQL